MTNQSKGLTMKLSDELILGVHAWMFEDITRLSEDITTWTIDRISDKEFTRRLGDHTARLRAEIKSLIDSDIADRNPADEVGG
jgi:hypothetical protein